MAFWVSNHIVEIVMINTGCFKYRMFHNAAVDVFAEIILEVTDMLFSQHGEKLPSLSENKVGNHKHM